MASTSNGQYYKIIEADVMEGLKSFPDWTFDCVVTSPPYWGLRRYHTNPIIWGGDPGCPHDWGEEVLGDARGGSGPRAKEAYAKTGGEAEAKSVYARSSNCGRFCRICKAWRGELGAEPTPYLYVEHLTSVFSEVRRVLRPDGVMWLVIDDTYANDGKWGGHTGGKHVQALHGEPVGRARRQTGLKN